MRELRKEDYRAFQPFKIGVCIDCKGLYLKQTWNKRCGNCSYGSSRTMKALLTEQQLLELLDLQKAMIKYNQDKVNKMEAEELAAEKKETDELREEVRKKYETAVLGNKTKHG